MRVNNSSTIDFQKIIENYPDHIIIVDKELNIQYVNYPSPGLTNEELIGMPLYLFVEQDLQEDIKRLLESVIDTGKTSNYETEYTTPDNETIYYESIAIPRVDNNEIVGLTIAARNITSRKKVEAQINTLTGLLPLCASCKKIRDAKGNWVILEKYLTDRDVDVTHGLCPPCYKTSLREFPYKEPD